MNFLPTCRRCGHRELRGLSGAVDVRRPRPGASEVHFRCRRCGGPAIDSPRGSDPSGPSPRTTNPPPVGRTAAITPLRSVPPPSAVVLVVGVPPRWSARRVRAQLPVDGRIDVVVVAERVPGPRSHPTIEAELGTSTLAPGVAHRVVAGRRACEVVVRTAAEAVDDLRSRPQVPVHVVAAATLIDRWWAVRLGRRLRRRTTRRDRPIGSSAVAQLSPGPIRREQGARHRSRAS